LTGDDIDAPKNLSRKETKLEKLVEN